MLRAFLFIVSLIAIFGCGDQGQPLPVQQQQNTAAADSFNNVLRKVSAIPIPRYTAAGTCGDSAYWSIVRSGKAALPFLIDQLGDTSYTRVAVACKAATLRVNHLAFALFERICAFPMATVTHMQFDSYEEGCPFPAGLTEYIDKDPARFQRLLRQWFDRNRPLLQWQPRNDSCARQQGVSGYWATPR